MTKRLIDIVVSGLLLIVAAPLGLLIVPVLAVTGEREVFFSQLRIGQGGRRFKLLKFATMLKASPQMGTGTVTVPDDPRVLPVGRVLRKTKINELPQLWNVLVGDMSLVGPRPLAQADFDCYEEGVQRALMTIRPGLTGIGSIVFRDEESLLGQSELPPLEAYRLEIAPRKGKLELWYLENQSLGLDAKLLFLTAVSVLSPRSRLHERLLPKAYRASEWN